jgi:hypothetical protein
MAFKKGGPNQLALGHWLDCAGFKYSCFISWSHDDRVENDPIADLVKRLKQRVEAELSRHGLPWRVYVDKEVHLGAQWLPQMMEALCRSLTMVAICCPHYYQSKDCGREWGLMEQISTRRLGKKAEVIVPLIWQAARSGETIGIRPEEEYPEAVRRYQYRDLTRVRMWSRDFHRHKEFDRIVAAIVSSVRRVGLAMEQQSVPAGRCRRLELPKSVFSDYVQAAQEYPFLKRRARKSGSNA